MRAVQSIAAWSVRQDGAIEAIANRLLTIDDPQLRESMAFSVASMWGSRSPDEAMSWLLANDSIWKGARSFALSRAAANTRSAAAPPRQ